MKPWKMPVWMKPFAPYVTNTSSNDTDRVAVVEKMYNGNADPVINLPLSTLQACVKSQVLMLYRLHEQHMLPTPFSVERAVKVMRMERALEVIDVGMSVVLGSRKLPKSVRPGLEAVADEARQGLGR